MRGIDKGLGSCEICHQIVSFPPRKEEDITAICPRCGHIVHQRVPHSVEESWALVIASIIFYIPANMLPMMHVYSFAGTQSDTIISGVIYFFNHGSYFHSYYNIYSKCNCTYYKSSDFNPSIDIGTKE